MKKREPIEAVDLAERYVLKALGALESADFSTCEQSDQNDVALFWDTLGVAGRIAKRCQFKATCAAKKAVSP